ncbi:hypothetical protein [Streptomyces sp. cmx-4-9]|uniref:hypothetical protein n=1 Tax=Streptomyces sp. cmx-4-9 TaxID=2790941 RepID=UPI003981717F
MAEIEITDELVALQQASDEAHAYLKQLTEKFGRPTQDGGWSEERHADWDAAWAAWSDRVGIAQAAVTEHAAATGQDRGMVEAAVKSAVRHPAPAEA